MKNFINKIIYGDSCSGKTFLFKKIKKKNIDLDFIILYKKIKLKFEFFFRIIEQKIFKILLKLKKKIFLGGGCIYFPIEKNFLLMKNNSIIKLSKRLIIDNYNRPTLKKKEYLKIRFCIRKKKYFKIFNILLTKCFKCNILLL
ncbi:hypothetical protein MEJ65_00150 [Candidatus Carsonella ruddii]|uniref:Uncharacterized protein n=1 Tax=Carsonella ruddii TaxID=114186 RepID=A0AAJ6FKG0_CARRU|nr:hypothetical protein [Candidatus Carsonella ruddii]WGS66697.1 hypothetical protein MEJ66_00150 [Candidatus Carsonella ruddii]WGS66892.1 hypothetical protein MEJ62_00145 [Candidatus Carsonella ruddii]WGS67084.1 hypothetical protein MEJ60_00145 [Candidatus Carsonella ruddii]WGS67277.1 hypothetical protein MEJ65_00150 [Candidatus Carsonella ruddii]WMC18293.1 MAG: hypothetical protein NU472_00150 [Candidatus Carsonella ruddii]